MQILSITLVVLGLFSSVLAVPGDTFDVCSQKCGSNPQDQQRLNAWKFQETEQDKCFFKCCFEALQILSAQGDVDTGKFSALVAGKGETVDISPVTVKNINAPGFLGNFLSFMAKNKAMLIRIFNHPEAA